MTDKLSKYVSWVLIALMAVSVVLAVLFYFANLNESTLMQWAYVLLGGVILISIISPIYSFILQPKNIVKLLIGLGFVLVIAIIAYSASANTFSDARLTALKTTAEISAQVGMGLLFTYITAGIAILAVLFSSISKFFK